MDKKKIIELRGRAQALHPTVHLGKEGITETVVDETAKQLDKKKLVKVKLLPSLERDRRSVAKELADRTHSVLVEVRGFTAVLAKE